jgi:peptidoglycan/LPS O-acetylase OafA/YrhL
VSIRYRADIDGLRAIAVLGVVFYHVGGLGVRGGYVGVDVFFVISGFLITGILARELDADSFSLANFYVRRIRRIVPALAAMLIGSTIAAAFILFPTDFKEYGKSLLSVASLVSNVYFGRRTGYFDGTSDDKPLLHTWSLAVEEQYYLVFPLLLFALYRWHRRAVLPALAVLALLSLAYGIFETSRLPEWAFYSSGVRAWELLLGALCALASPAFQAPRWVRELTAAAGLVLIAVAYGFFSDATPFPGYLALVPCLGAAAVIVGSERDETAVSKLLSLRVLVGIGLISYSIYLWHWPLLIFAKYRFAFMPSLRHEEALALIAASIALGYLSWRFVERPFRRPGGRQATFRGAAAFFALTAFASLLIVQTKGLPARWPKAIDVARSGHGIPCRPVPVQSGWPRGTCLLGDTDARFDTLIRGDSHAGMLADGIARHLAAAKRGAILVTGGGCPPLVGVRLHGKRKAESCEARGRLVLAKLAGGGIDRIVLAARWAYYAEGERMPEEAGQPLRLSADPSANSEIFNRLLGETVASLKPLVRQVVLIGPVPEVDFLVGRAVSRNIAWGRPLPPETPRADYESRQRHVFPVLAAMAHEPAVRVVFPDRWLCNASTCAYTVGAEPLYNDTNHLTPRGEQQLDQMFELMFVDVAHS